MSLYTRVPTGHIVFNNYEEKTLRTVEIKGKKIVSVDDPDWNIVRVVYNESAEPLEEIQITLAGKS